MNRDFFLLQVNDAAFPIGAYSHSFGLETYVQRGLVHDRKSAEEYVRNKLEYSLKYYELLSARLASDYTADNDLPGLIQLEEYLEAARSPREIRLANNKLAARFVRTISQMGAAPDSPIWEQYLEARMKTGMSHSVVYSVACTAWGIGEQSMLQNYLYAQVSAIVTCCVKSVPLSQGDGQAILYGRHGQMERILRELPGLNFQDLAGSAPGFDIRSMQHECLYSRLYMS